MIVSVLLRYLAGVSGANAIPHSVQGITRKPMGQVHASLGAFGRST
ncbi:hypothetical protein [Paenibacillus glycinis]|uniref:Uncharacterized protein n=1 Tax=Paenibacillus glycinis TaxID=2697035 RepID=A0ABW9XYY4_9BACL|nr:hypothetical protein [Paenibacillus glycinis]NBD27464.1 hypothetical protein [Paenibacillus glycinis]